ncbi:MAG: hypothetical protein GY822_03980 [Deltaproteobacteria bacterium]|nr:hypothetical protein [Deltaproteobacteria bacterium]
MASANTHTVFETDPVTVERELGSLTFSRVIGENPMMLLRAAHWHNLLDGLGLGLPLFLVHDIGLLLTQMVGTGIVIKARQRSLRLAVERGSMRIDPQVDVLLERYQGLLTDLARSELAQKSAAASLADELVAAVIAKVVEPVQGALVRKGHNRKLPLTVTTYEALEPAHFLSENVAQEVLSILRTVVDARTRIRVCLEQIDVDTMKLLEMFKGAQGMSDATDLLDIYRALSTPEVHDIVNFSLDLIPSVLETKRSSGVQTFSIDGYASIETQGNLDGLLPSELAYDDDLFDRRYADNELFYYGREKQSTQRERLHYLLIDASASMRGLRTVFARGLALALAKKMTLRGETVWLRFFDSRMYERQELSSSKLRIPYLLCFRSERGRNPTRVFTDLERELSRLMRESPKEVVVTFITHGRCQIETKLIETLSQKATLCGVFVMPSGGDMTLDYVDKLTQHHIITQDALSDKSKRQSEALKILSES